jgi:hypothetical protein
LEVSALLGLKNLQRNEQDYRGRRGHDAWR